MKLLFYKLFRKNKLATAYHEAGHCVVAALFANRIILHTLSINKGYLKNINPEYNGGLHLEWRDIPDEADHESGDNLILISLAWICSATLFSHGQKYVEENLPNFKNNPKLMEINGAVDDYAIAQSFSKPIAVRLQIRSQIIEWSAFRWVYEYLMNPEVWSATRQIAEKLIKHSKQTLTYQEIVDITLATGLRSFLDNNRNSFLAKRYPMTIATLKT